jgi:hypothetical protein
VVVTIVVVVVVVVIGVCEGFVEASDWVVATEDGGAVVVVVVVVVGLQGEARGGGGWSEVLHSVVVLSGGVSLGRTEQMLLERLALGGAARRT